ncbi:MAG: hypothetical protein JWO07_30 [Candidatus Saccharibacteria bacterium]|nr:hypothetical protein [Candidatus Saccharibacteria bacterium]
MSETPAPATSTKEAEKMAIWNDPELSTWEKAHAIKDLGDEAEVSTESADDKKQAIMNDEDKSDWEKVNEIRALDDAEPAADPGEAAPASPETFSATVESVVGPTAFAQMTPEMLKRIEDDPNLRTLVELQSKTDPDGESLGSIFEADEEARNALMAILAKLVPADTAAQTQDPATADQQPPRAWKDMTPEERGVAIAAKFGEDIAPTDRAGIGAQGVATALHISSANQSRKEKKALKRAAKRTKHEQELRDKGMTDAVEIKKELDKRERRTKILSRVAIGIASAAAAGLAIYGYEHFKYLLDNRTGAGSTPKVNDLPPSSAGSPSQEQLKHVFDTMPDTSKMTDKLHHANDFSPGNPALSANDKAGAIKNVTEMFQGNPNITAMWASQLHIPGAPVMPPVDVMQHSDAAVSAFNIKVNDWGTYLHDNPTAYNNVISQITDKLNKGTIGNEITLRPGYMSPGANNSLTQLIYGAKPSAPGSHDAHQVFMDPSVGYGDQKAREYIIDGQTYCWDEYCNQLSIQPPAQIAAPASVPQEIFHSQVGTVPAVPPAESIAPPPVNIAPPVDTVPPGGSPPPVDTPPIDTPPPVTRPVKGPGTNPGLPQMGSGIDEGNNPFTVAPPETHNGVTDAVRPGLGADPGRQSGLGVPGAREANPGAAPGASIGGGNNGPGSRPNAN